jgi:hypothetical protein
VFNNDPTREDFINSMTQISIQLIPLFLASLSCTFNTFIVNTFSQNLRDTRYKVNLTLCFNDEIDNFRICLKMTLLSILMLMLLLLLSMSKDRFKNPDEEISKSNNKFFSVTLSPRLVKDNLGKGS